jgi:hypothetical protein
MARRKIEERIRVHLWLDQGLKQDIENIFCQGNKMQLSEAVRQILSSYVRTIKARVEQSATPLPSDVELPR